MPIFGPNDYFICWYKVTSSPCLSIFTRTWTQQGIISSIKYLQGIRNSQSSPFWCHLSEIQQHFNWKKKQTQNKKNLLEIHLTNSGLSSSLRQWKMLCQWAPEHSHRQQGTRVGFQLRGQTADHDRWGQAAFTFLIQREKCFIEEWQVTGSQPLAWRLWLLLYFYVQ